MARPNDVSAVPLASHPAAGAKRSRPSNVRLTVARAYFRSCQLDDALRRRLAEHAGEHAVVGRDEPIVAGVRGEPAPPRSDARIDDDQKHRAGGKKR